MESARLWPRFAADVEAAAGRAVGYRTEGTLAVAADLDDLRVIEELWRFQQSLGLPVERLSRRGCRDLEPSLSPRVRGGVLAPGDTQVDNRLLLAALGEACRKAGVEVEHRRVTPRSLPDDDAVRAADRVVVAAGAWSAALVEASGPSVPVRPVKGQILRLRFDPTDPPLTHNLRGWVEGRSVYLVPRAGGELVVGATMEEQGFDTVVTAGAVYELLRAAAELVPGISELELVEARAGLRPGTPDNAPIVGPASGDRRLVYATGHFRNGILLAPVTAAAVTTLLCTGELPPSMAPFGPDRFRAAVSGGRR
jgi:glycine oxidase